MTGASTMCRALLAASILLVAAPRRLVRGICAGIGRRNLYGQRSVDVLGWGYAKVVRFSRG